MGRTVETSPGIFKYQLDAGDIEGLRRIRHAAGAVVGLHLRSPGAAQYLATPQYQALHDVVLEDAEMAAHKADKYTQAQQVAGPGYAGAALAGAPILSDPRRMHQLYARARELDPEIADLIAALAMQATVLGADLPADAILEPGSEAIESLPQSRAGL